MLKDIKPEGALTPELGRHTRTGIHRATYRKRGISWTLRRISVMSLHVRVSSVSIMMGTHTYTSCTHPQLNEMMPEALNTQAHTALCTCVRVSLFDVGAVFWHDERKGNEICWLGMHAEVGSAGELNASAL